MNIDSKLEAEKIAEELILGTVDQACEDYKNILGNYHFLTSSHIEKSFLKDLGIHIAKHARKQPENFLLFCKKVWIGAIKDGRTPVGLILANLETLNPDRIIPEIIEMCRNTAGREDVDILVTGFEPVFLREPNKYFTVLEHYITDDNIWVKRLIIVTSGHVMYRYKTYEITSRCLELLRPEISNECIHIRKATSWIIGSYGIRADQKAVASFMQSFAGSDNSVVVGNFSEAFRRSKIILQKDVSKILIPVFEQWSQSSNSNISKSACSALRLLKK